MRLATMFAIFAMLLCAAIPATSTEPAQIRVTTWNLEWFPSGSAKEASAEQQNQRIKEAADVLRSINPDVILLQEVRDYDACARLGEAIAPGVYHVAICSAFREPFHSGLGRQQVAILSKYQAQAAWSEPWKSMNGVDPPRGFAFAWFKIGTSNIGVYSVHLKSNLITRGDREAEAAKNIQKREVAVTQLLTHVRDVIGMTMPTIKDFVIGGDFNTNHDQAMFAAERTLASLSGAAYRSVFEAIPLTQRITHPGSHGYPDATFDYLFGKKVRMGKATKIAFSGLYTRNHGNPVPPPRARARGRRPTSTQKCVLTPSGRGSEHRAAASPLGDSSQAL